MRAWKAVDAWCVSFGTALVVVTMLIGGGEGCCGNNECLRPNKPVPAIDGSYCKAADKTLETLGCRWGDGSPTWVNPKGKRYWELCEDAGKDGRDWHPQCVAAIVKCGQLEEAYEGVLCPK